jgi:hypothetical protein
MDRREHKVVEAVEFPAEMLAEIERLGEDRADLEYWARQEGFEFARLMLEDTAYEAALFDKWFPRLQEFADEMRLANPLPDERTLSSLDRAIRRILQPKIQNQEVLPQHRKYRVPIFTAPLAVLPLVIAHWSATYTNPIFLTADEACAWGKLYDAPDDAPWWNFYYNWTATPNPSADDFWMKGSGPVPTGTMPVLVRWGTCVGSLAGSWLIELWCVDTNGVETLVEDLGFAVS